MTRLRIVVMIVLILLTVIFVRKIQKRKNWQKTQKHTRVGIPSIPHTESRDESTLLFLCTKVRNPACHFRNRRRRRQASGRKRGAKDECKKKVQDSGKCAAGAVRHADSRSWHGGAETADPGPHDSERARGSAGFFFRADWKLDRDKGGGKHGIF